MTAAILDSTRATDVAMPKFIDLRLKVRDPETVLELWRHGEDGDDGGHAIHLPGPSYYPLIAALGLPVLGYGLIFGVGYVVAGLVIMLAGLFGWVLEPSAE